MYHPDLMRHPDSCPALVLNADYTPLSYYPLSIWPWQTAVKAVFLERVDIVSHYEREVRARRHGDQAAVGDCAAPICEAVGAPAFTASICSCAIASAVNIAAASTISRTVMSCRAQGRADDGNVSTACAPCNLRKGGRTRRRRIWR